MTVKIVESYDVERSITSSRIVANDVSSAIAEAGDLDHDAESRPS